MIASLIGILAGFILLMVGLILGVHSDHKVIGVLIMFAGLISMLNFFLILNIFDLVFYIPDCE